MTRTTAAHRSTLAILAFVTFLAALPARALLPENGWYWNPGQSGRGFNIEIQDDALFLSAFVYRADGTPAWYVGGGSMSSDRAWTADLFETTGGQCIGCPYRAPTLLPAGSVSVSFTNERAATISLLGGTVSVVRHDWSGYGAASSDALLGEWSTTEGDPGFPVYFGERISLATARTGSSGPYVAGNRTGDSGDLAVGNYSAALGAHSMLLDSSISYYRYYVFSLDTLNRIHGVSWTYRKSESPTGSGTHFLGHRTKSPKRVRGFNAPGVNKSRAAMPEREAIDAARAARSVAKEGGPIALEGVTIERVRETARELQAVLEGALR